MRSALVRFLRFCIALFYRRVEIAGLDRVPRDGGVVFAVNHPNGLIDPLFVLGYAPRAISFLAKAPLFRYPVIGWFVRTLDSIPVYRKQDEVHGSNSETFQKAREILARRGGIAIFPEGTTHSDPQLRDLKTGAARIALGAASAGDPPVIVPTGIYYSAKQTFRSDALVVFGSPIEVPRVAPGEDGEPPREAVAGLTAKIDRGLDAVTVQADSHAALELVALAEDIFSSTDSQRVTQEFTLRRRFIEGYHALRSFDPARLDRLASRIRRFGAELEERDLEAHELVPRFRMTVVITLVFLLPLAMTGAVLHLPTYSLVSVLARRFAKGESETTATMKFIAALFLYPLTWIAYAAVAWRIFGGEVAVGVLLAVPLLALIALRVFERLDSTIGRIRALAGGHRERLIAERDAIRAEIVAIGEWMDAKRSAPSA